MRRMIGVAKDQGGLYYLPNICGEDCPSSKLLNSCHETASRTNAS